jgi:selenocysteine lyase/cysteine desulfurase
VHRAEWRNLFPVTRNLIYFNHAAVGTLSTRAYEAMQRQAEDHREFGALHWRDWFAEYDQLRASGGRLIGAQPSEISILKNTSEGLSFVAEGYRWKSGENVIITDLEFPSNYTPWRNLQRRGVECRVVRSREGAFSADDIEHLIDDRTRIVAVSSVAFHNGFAADLEAIGEVCARRNVLLCVDAIQSIGALPMDVRKSKIAFLAADGHKWMCGPEGATIFYVAAEHRDRLEVLEHGWMNINRQGKFLQCEVDLLPDGRRFEAGSLNTNGIYGLRAAIDLLLEIGVDAIGAEVVRLASTLAERIEEIGWRVVNARPIRSGIVGAIPPGVEPSVLRWHRLLEENGVICSPREGMLRFSPHFYNDNAEIDRLVNLLSSRR